MKKLCLALTALSCLLAIPSLRAVDLTKTIPIINGEEKIPGFEKVPDVAQYGLADWSNVIGMAKGVTLSQAVEIAASNPEITYFFHMKGLAMHLGNNEQGWRSFYYGDAVFFSGTPWWGSAIGYADGYIKTNQ